MISIDLTVPLQHTQNWEYKTVASLVWKYNYQEPG